MHVGSIIRIKVLIPVSTLEAFTSVFEIISEETEIFKLISKATLLSLQL